MWIPLLLREPQTSYFVIFFNLAGGILYYLRKIATANLPPSPPGNILLGHALKVPPSYQWETFAAWGKRYGSILYIHVFGRPMIICNSFNIARELLDKRSNNYSDRPTMMSGEMLGVGSVILSLKYGDRWRKHRRIVQAAFDQQASVAFRPAIQVEIENFIRDVVNFSGDIKPKIHRLVASSLCMIAYGHEVTSDDDELVKKMEKVDEVSRIIGSPGSTPLDFFPFLRYIPPWFPGLSFPRFFAEGRKITEIAFAAPIKLIRKERDAGILSHSFLGQLVEDMDSKGNKDPNEEEDVMSLGAAVFLAGAETSDSALYTFFLMMILHPEVKRRAQGDLDDFMNSTQRLPTLSDRDLLPYVDCIVKEVYRINPPVPLGIPHRSMEEDEYEGWRIPARSMVITNIWQMMRDEQYFPNAHRFMPDRHLKKSCGMESDPMKIIFGFGRRICPGRFFADELIWLTIANVLSVFDILPALDAKTGKQIIPKMEFTSGVLSTSKPYSCRIIPRSDFQKKLIDELAI